MAFLRKFLRKSQPINTQKNHQQKRTSPCREMIVSTSYWLLNILTKSFFQATRIHFISNSTTIKTLYNNNNVFLSLQKRNPVDSGLFTGLGHNHSERYGLRLDNFLLGTSNCSVQLFDKSKRTVLGQPFSSRSHHSQPAGHVGDARQGPGQRW